ncbi:tripartite motif-containing protein 45 isoform X1 [Eumetopias jubatus]|uniref:tripartite motif-containing protein 45 isoform X1 n=1 Tax=Eumetopias jubatus TaxID=34886 RepID=UPI001015EC4C|nr:tripartite motif-containing protein 45 isoform X1 [Eumetopias jubatus]XP_027957928.1 tripartite motif-containing protein 45 isoform X1 [Eumetopias jubatus]
MSEKRKPLLGFVGKLPSGTALGNSGKTHCPLCMGLFKAPRLLPCLHTVCTTCLEQLEPFSIVDIRGGDSDTSSEGSIFQELKPPSLQLQIGILCPVCDAQVDLPMGGVKALTIDHLAMNDVMLESLQGEGQGLVCDLCSNREVEKRCQTCKANLCHFCCQAHRFHSWRQKKTTYHTMVDRKDLKGCSRIGKPVLCPAHPAEDLRLFCELCDQPVCQDCVVGAHREHPCDFTSNVIHKHGDSVRELLRGTQPHVEALEEALAQIKGMNSALQAQVGAVAADVRTFSEGYIKAIEEHRDKLLKQLEDIRVQKENSLQLQKAQLEQLLADMRTGVEFTEHLLTSGSDLEILITKGVVVERLTKLNKVEYSIHPGVNDKICFSPQQKAGRCRGYEVYGAISTKEVDPAKCVLQGEDLHRAQEKQTASFTLLCKDAAGESMGRGGDGVQVAVIPKDKKDSPVRALVHDNQDGTYRVSYTPEEPGVYTVLVCIKEQHVQGSPFTVTVRKRHRPHPGVFQGCTFCSSGGQKTAHCGGTMPGGYLGCGHGHKGHPGRPHWSCCGKFAEKSECTWTGGQNAPRSLLRTVAL